MEATPPCAHTHTHTLTSQLTGAKRKTHVTHNSKLNCEFAIFITSARASRLRNLTELFRSIFWFRRQIIKVWKHFMTQENPVRVSPSQLPCLCATYTCICFNDKPKKWIVCTSFLCHYEKNICKHLVCFPQRWFWALWKAFMHLWTCFANTALWDRIWNLNENESVIRRWTLFFCNFNPGQESL